MRAQLTKCGCLLLLLWPASARSQSAQSASLFRLNGWNGSLIFRLQNENQLSPLFTQEREFNESLQLRNSGFIINPQLLNFEWTGDLKFLQERYSSPYVRQHSVGRFIGQTFTASLLKDSSHPFLFALSRNANSIKLEYAGHSTHNITGVQATLDLPAFSLPSRFYAEQRDIWEEWSRAGFTAPRNQVRRTFEYSGRKQREDFTLDLDYDFFNNHDRLVSDRSYSTHNASFQTRRAFCKTRANVWNNNTRLLLRRGLADHTSAQTTQSLELQHSPWLSSKYRYNLSAIRTLRQTALENAGYASVGFRFYSSLSTNAGAGGSYGSSNLGNFDSRQINGGLNYTKKVPFAGHLQIGYSRNYGVNNRRIESTEQAVANERHIFLGAFPVVLEERNIIASSILVIDEESKLIYEEGEDKDYFIRIAGDYVEIHRNLLGRIREGASVLIDYRFHTLPAMRYAIDTEIFNASLTFGGLSFYHRVNHHDANIISGSLHDESALGDLFTRATGVQGNWRGVSAGLSLLGEYKLQDSKAYAYEMVNVRQSMFLKPSYNFTLSFSSMYAMLDHVCDDLRIKNYAFGSELQWHPTMELIVQSFARYNSRRETKRAEEINYEWGVTLQRHWRVIKLLLSYEKRRWEFDPRFIDERRFTAEIERIF